MEYIRVKTKKGILILTTEEYEQGLDRENEGVDLNKLFEEEEYLAGYEH